MLVNDDDSIASVRGWNDVVKIEVEVEGRVMLRASLETVACAAARPAPRDAFVISIHHIPSLLPLDLAKWYMISLSATAVERC